VPKVASTSPDALVTGIDQAAFRPMASGRWARPSQPRSVAKSRVTTIWPVAAACAQVPTPSAAPMPSTAAL
jgi:hypothetical protein